MHWSSAHFCLSTLDKIVFWRAKADENVIPIKTRTLCREITETFFCTCRFVEFTICGEDCRPFSAWILPWRGMGLRATWPSCVVWLSHWISHLRRVKVSIIVVLLRNVPMHVTKAVLLCCGSSFTREKKKDLNLFTVREFPVYKRCHRPKQDVTNTFAPKMYHCWNCFKWLLKWPQNKFYLHCTNQKKSI